MAKSTLVPRKSETQLQARTRTKGRTGGFATAHRIENCGQGQLAKYDRSKLLDVFGQIKGSGTGILSSRSGKVRGEWLLLCRT